MIRSSEVVARLLAAPRLLPYYWTRRSLLEPANGGFANKKEGCCATVLLDGDDSSSKDFGRYKMGTLN